MEKRKKVIESALQCVDDAVGVNTDNERGRRDRIATLFIDAVGVSEDANNLHECLDVIGKEPNPFARVHLLWDTIDAVTNYPHQHKNSHLVGERLFGQTKRRSINTTRELWCIIAQKRNFEPVEIVRVYGRREM